MIIFLNTEIHENIFNSYIRRIEGIRHQQASEHSVAINRPMCDSIGLFAWNFSILNKKNYPNGQDFFFNGATKSKILFRKLIFSWWMSMVGNDVCCLSCPLLKSTHVEMIF